MGDEISSFELLIIVIGFTLMIPVFAVMDFFDRLLKSPEVIEE